MKLVIVSATLNLAVLQTMQELTRRAKTGFHAAFRIAIWAEIRRTFMKMSLFIAAVALVATIAIAHAQSVSKPTKADVENVVQMINADQAKKEAYCQLQALDSQMAAADQRKDQAAIDSLGKQADELSEKLGPEYAKLMQGLGQVPPEEGKQFSQMFAQLCKK